LEIGAVFTPTAWGKFAAQKYNILRDWLAGKTIFDPTMGDGALLEALVDFALESGHTLNTLPLINLYGAELNAQYHARAICKFKGKYNIDMSDRFYNADILTFSPVKADILFGNPPWQNFADLPPEYKEYAKQFFHKFDLIGSAKELLLGNARMDIAALIIQKTIIENLKDNGRAVFFLPLSILLNAGANKNFRLFTGKGVRYSLSSVYDCDKLHVFEGTATRYGIARFDRDAPQRYPIPWHRHENEAWQKYAASPVPVPGGALLVHDGSQKILPKIEVPADAAPRQGVNTCGANDIFFFDEYSSVDGEMCALNNKLILPKQFIFPLITSKNFSGLSVPEKWVLLPYNKHTGKALTEEELKKYPSLRDYLEGSKDRLRSRKGAMLRAHIQRGLWWSLLGVGKYSFAKYKIVWEAYGKKKFNPQIFDGDWQANQSLQACMPCADKSAAEKILGDLRHPSVEEYLLASKMEGTMNWAQPGKISPLLSFPGKQQSLPGSQ